LSFYFQTNFEGLLGGGDLGEVANDIISGMIPDLVEQLKPTVLPGLIDTVIEMANGFLGDLTLQDLLDLINGGGALRAKRL
jgi:hypothetical protein